MQREAFGVTAWLARRVQRKHGFQRGRRAQREVFSRHVSSALWTDAGTAGTVAGNRILFCGERW